MAHFIANVLKNKKIVRNCKAEILKNYGASGSENFKNFKVYYKNKNKTFPGTIKSYHRNIWIQFNIQPFAIYPFACIVFFICDSNVKTFFFVSKLNF